MKQNLKRYLEKFNLSKSQITFITVAFGFLGLFLLVGVEAMAQLDIPGDNKSTSLTMAGTTLKTVDSVVFTWIAPLIAGVFVIVAGIQIKEQRYSLAAMAFVAALLLGTAGSWVKNIFDIGGGEGSGGVFDQGFHIEKTIDVRVV